MIIETAVDAADGVLEIREGRQVLRLQRQFAFPIDRVWEALIEPEQFSTWYPFPVVERDLRVGGTIRFDAGEGTTLDGAVTELDPPHVFGFRELDDLLQFTLQPADTGCLLTLAHTFDYRSMAARCAAGWHFCLDALAAVLEQRAVTEPSEAQRFALREAYTRHFEAAGTVEQAADQQVVRFQRHLSHPVARVWAALTDPAQLIAWLGAAEIDLVEGGRFDLRWLNVDEHGEPFTMHATITRLEPPHLLETRGDAHGILRWELQPDGEGTLLRFSSTLALPDAFHAKVLAGWHYHLDALATALAGGTTDLVHLPNARWYEVHARYA